MSVPLPLSQDQEEEAATETTSLYSNRNQNWYRKLCRPGKIPLIQEEPKQDFPSPLRLQLQMHFQREYQQQQELQKNCRQDWWTRKSGVASVSPTPFHYRSPSPVHKYYTGAPLFYQDAPQPQQTSHPILRRRPPPPPTKNFYPPNASNVRGLSSENRRKIKQELVDSEREKMIKAAHMIKHETEKRIQQARRELSTTANDQESIQRMIIQLLREQELAEKLKISQTPPTPRPVSNPPTDLQYKLANLLQAYQQASTQQLSASYQRSWRDQVATYHDMLQEYRQGNVYQSYEKAKQLLQLLLQKEPRPTQVRFSPQFFPQNSHQPQFYHQQPNHVENANMQPFFRAPLPPQANFSRRDPRLNRSSQQYQTQTHNITPRLNQSSYQYSEQDITPEIIYQADVIKHRSAVGRRNSTPRKQSDDESAPDDSSEVFKDGTKKQQRGQQERPPEKSKVDKESQTFTNARENEIRDLDAMDASRSVLAERSQQEYDVRSGSRGRLEDWEQLQQRSQRHRRGRRYRRPSEEVMAGGQKKQVDDRETRSQPSVVRSRSKEEERSSSDEQAHRKPEKNTSADKKEKVSVSTNTDEWNDREEEPESKVSSVRVQYKTPRSIDQNDDAQTLNDPTDTQNENQESRPSDQKLTNQNRIAAIAEAPQTKSNGERQNNKTEKSIFLQNDGQQDHVKTTDNGKNKEETVQKKTSAQEVHSSLQNGPVFLASAADVLEKSNQNQEHEDATASNQAAEGQTAQMSVSELKRHRNEKLKTQDPRQTAESQMSHGKTEKSPPFRSTGKSSSKPPFREHQKTSRSQLSTQHSEAETRHTNHERKSPESIVSQNKSEHVAKSGETKSPENTTSRQGGKKSPGSAYVVRNSGQRSSKPSPGSQSEKSESAKSPSNASSRSKNSSPKSNASKSSPDSVGKTHVSPPLAKPKRHRYRRKSWDKTERPDTYNATSGPDTVPHDQHRLHDRTREYGQQRSWRKSSPRRWAGRRYDNWDPYPRRRPYQWDDSKTAPARKWRAAGRQAEASLVKVDPARDLQGKLETHREKPWVSVELEKATTGAEQNALDSDLQIDFQVQTEDKIVTQTGQETDMEEKPEHHVKSIDISQQEYVVKDKAQIAPKQSDEIPHHEEGEKDNHIRFTDKDDTGHNAWKKKSQGLVQDGKENQRAHRPETGDGHRRNITDNENIPNIPAGLEIVEHPGKDNKETKATQRGQEDATEMLADTRDGEKKKVAQRPDTDTEAQRQTEHRIRKVGEETTHTGPAFQNGKSNVCKIETGVHIESTNTQETWSEPQDVSKEIPKTNFESRSDTEETPETVPEIQAGNGTGTEFQAGKTDIPLEHQDGKEADIKSHAGSKTLETRTNYQDGKEETSDPVAEPQARGDEMSEIQARLHAYEEETSETWYIPQAGKKTCETVTEPMFNKKETVQIQTEPHADIEQTPDVQTDEKEAPETWTEPQEAKQKKPEMLTELHASKEETLESQTELQTGKEKTPESPTEHRTSKEKITESQTELHASKKTPESPTEPHAGKEKTPESPTELHAGKEKTSQSPTELHAGKKTPESPTELHAGKKTPESPTELYAGKKTPESPTELHAGKEKTPESPTELHAGKEKTPETQTELCAGKDETWAEVQANEEGISEVKTEPRTGIENTLDIQSENRFDKEDAPKTQTEPLFGNSESQSKPQSDKEWTSEVQTGTQTSQKKTPQIENIHQAGEQKTPETQNKPQTGQEKTTETKHEPQAGHEKIPETENKPQPGHEETPETWAKSQTGKTELLNTRYEFQDGRKRLEDQNEPQAGKEMTNTGTEPDTDKEQTQKPLSAPHAGKEKTPEPLAASDTGRGKTLEPPVASHTAKEKTPEPLVEPHTDKDTTFKLQMQAQIHGIETRVEPKEDIPQTQVEPQSVKQKTSEPQTKTQDDKTKKQETSLEHVLAVLGKTVVPDEDDDFTEEKTSLSHTLHSPKSEDTGCDMQDSLISASSLPSVVSDTVDTKTSQKSEDTGCEMQDSLTSASSLPSVASDTLKMKTSQSSENAGWKVPDVLMGASSLPSGASHTLETKTSQEQALHSQVKKITENFSSPLNISTSAGDSHKNKQQSFWSQCGTNQNMDDQNVSTKSPLDTSAKLVLLEDMEDWQCLDVPDIQKKDKPEIDQMKTKQSGISVRYQCQNSLTEEQKLESFVEQQESLEEQHIATTVTQTAMSKGTADQCEKPTVDQYQKRDDTNQNTHSKENTTVASEHSERLQKMVKQDAPKSSTQDDFADENAPAVVATNENGYHADSTKNEHPSETFSKTEHKTTQERNVNTRCISDERLVSRDLSSGHKSDISEPSQMNKIKVDRVNPESASLSEPRLEIASVNQTCVETGYKPREPDDNLQCSSKLGTNELPEKGSHLISVDKLTSLALASIGDSNCATVCKNGHLHMMTFEETDKCHQDKETENVKNISNERTETQDSGIPLTCFDTNGTMLLCGPPCVEGATDESSRIQTKCSLKNQSYAQSPEISVQNAAGPTVSKPCIVQTGNRVENEENDVNVREAFKNATSPTYNRTGTINTAVATDSGKKKNVTFSDTLISKSDFTPSSPQNRFRDEAKGRVNTADISQKHGVRLKSPPADVTSFHWDDPRNENCEEIQQTGVVCSACGKLRFPENVSNETDDGMVLIDKLTANGYL